MALSTNAWLGIGAVAAIGGFFWWKTSHAKSLSAAPGPAPTEGATDAAPTAQPNAVAAAAAQTSYGEQVWNFFGGTPKEVPPALDASGGFDLGTVTGVQGALKLLGYDIKVDGKYGPNSKAAVKAFQISRALKGDAVVGGATRAAIATALYERGANASYSPSAPLIKGVYGGYPLHYYYR